MFPFPIFMVLHISLAILSTVILPFSFPSNLICFICFLDGVYYIAEFSNMQPLIYLLGIAVLKNLL